LLLLKNLFFLLRKSEQQPSETQRFEQEDAEGAEIRGENWREFLLKRGD